MPAPPLTHHEILGLVEPFTRRGRRVDLAASDRQHRRVLFKPIEHPTLEWAGPGLPGLTGLRETLVLENPEPDTYRLTRVLALPGGLEARLQTEGPQPKELLAQVESVVPQRQVLAGAGFVIARSHRLEPSGARGADAGPTRMILTHAEAQVAGFLLALQVSRISGIPAEIEFRTASGEAADLPQDLLAVLGLPWSRLNRSKNGWRGSLMLRGRDPERSRDAERKLERTVRHLASTLAEAPGRFHDRFRPARWRVVLRRAVPLLAVLGLFGAALAVPYLGFADDSVFRMLILNSPPLLLLLFFSMRELPRIEIPPWPRRPSDAAWRVVPLPASSAAPVQAGSTQSLGA